MSSTTRLFVASPLQHVLAAPIMMQLYAPAGLMVGGHTCGVGGSSHMACITLICWVSGLRGAVTCTQQQFAGVSRIPSALHQALASHTPKVLRVHY